MKRHTCSLKKNQLFCSSFPFPWYVLFLSNLLNLALVSCIPWELRRPSSTPSSQELLCICSMNSDHLWRKYLCKTYHCRSMDWCLYFVSNKISYNTKYAPTGNCPGAHFLLLTHFFLTFFHLLNIQIMVDTFGSLSLKTHSHVRLPHSAEELSHLTQSVIGAAQMHTVTHNPN